MHDSLRDRLAGVAKSHAALDLLVLHGSRARGDAGPGSDWDFAYLAGPALDAPALAADLVSVVGSEAVDVADLARSSGQLRYRAAIDGVVLVEARPGAFDAFRLEAIDYWCEMQGIIRAEYEAALAGVSR